MWGRVANVVADHDSLLTQWRYIRISKFRTNIFSLATTSSDFWTSVIGVVKNDYRKVASSRPVYYSIFYLFWGATNQDVLLTETCYYCYIQKSIKWWMHKGPCVFSSIFVNSQWLALFLQTPFKNVLKTLDGAFWLLWKCNFISKNWKNLTRIFEDPTFWIYFSNQNVGSSRILIRFFQFLLG